MKVVWLLVILVCLVLFNVCVLYHFQLSLDSKQEKLDIDVFVVNLEKRKEKWIQMERKCETAFPGNFPRPERFDAIDGGTIDLISLYEGGMLTEEAYNSLLRLRDVNGRHLTIGGLGCSLSHIELWRECIERDRIMLILEDDVTFHPEFAKRVVELLQQAKTFNFGLLYLADLVNSTKTRAVQQSIPQAPLIWKLTGEFWGTYGYFISPRVAVTLVDEAYPIRLQIDSYMIKTASAEHFPVYRSKENLVVTDNSPNRISDVQIDIEEKRIDPIYSNSIQILDSMDGELSSKVKVLFPSATMWTRQKIKRELHLEPDDQFQLFQIQMTLLYQYGGIVLSRKSRKKRWRKPLKLKSLLKRRLPAMVRYTNGIVAFERDGDNYLYPVMAAPAKSEWVGRVLKYCNTIQREDDRQMQLYQWLRQHLTSFAPQINSTILAPLQVLV